MKNVVKRTEPFCGRAALCVYLVYDVTRDDVVSLLTFHERDA